MNKLTKIFILVGILASIFVLLTFRRNKPKEKINTSSLTENKNQANEDSSFSENLRKRNYESSSIEIENTLSNSEPYSSYIFSYISDDLKIYGRMNMPNSGGPFPVVILNHGYFNQSSFQSGDGTQTMADILARNGYLTLASDYRGFGKSENDSQGSRGHNPNYSIDVLNLIASVKNLDKADPNKIGIWGHSMGGEVSIRTAEVTDKVKAIVLWAPTSANPSENAAFYGRGRHGSLPSPSQTREEISPNNDLRYITAPVSLHQGLADTEVNPAWSKELNEALQKENKQVEYFEYPGQDHNFSNLGWDIISKRTTEFFDRYLK
ncbi:alpha/beta fold hydrolase [Candidatus Roizmanbacteria bacterium]|nr:alpha/beta fold hydrolase [Candidatus Roizmanbacteria bacterium]